MNQTKERCRLFKDGCCRCSKCTYCCYTQQSVNSFASLYSQSKNYRSLPEKDHSSEVPKSS